MIKSANVTATGTLVSSPARVVGIYIRDAATAGSAEFKDGGTGGTSMLILNTPAGAATEYVSIPEPGMDFLTDVHVTLTNADGVTIFYK